jgi:hypothetical protein
MKSILLSILSFLLYTGANSQTIKGKLIDNKSEPLIGATVFVEGTKSGAQTDLNGDM